MKKPQFGRKQHPSVVHVQRTIKKTSEMNKSKQVRSLVFFFLLTVLILGCMQYVLRLSPSLIDIDLLDTRAFWARKEMLKLFTTIHEKGGKQAVRNLRLFYFLDLVFPLGYAGLLSLFFSTQLKLMVNTKAPKPLARKCIPAMFVIGEFFFHGEGNSGHWPLKNINHYILRRIF